jgi:hypothetical protein
MQHQYSLTLIQRQVSNTIVEQRGDDGYINATALCKAAGKRWHNYVRQETTGHFLRALTAKTRISALELIQEVTIAGVTAMWIHPKVAINLAQWLSADFAVQVSEWVYEWMDEKTRPAQGPAKLPPHLQRYISNDGKVPPGYFSVLQETGLNLFGPLHNVGFEIPKGWVPDISVGLKFCAHLRTEHEVDTDALPTYPHDYLDGRAPVNAKLYPEDLLPAFRRWFRNVWLPQYGTEYFKRKDPASLPFLDRLPALSGPSSATARLPG